MSDRIITLTEIRAGSDLFKSSGFSHVKVTRDGKASVLRLAIKSTGVTEVIERIRESEPKPPTKPLAVTGDTAEGRAYGLRRGDKKIISAPDFADKDYLAARERYEQELVLEIINQGLDVPIKDAAGQVITERDQKIAALEALGISMNQLQQIVSDIQELTTLSEKDKEDFFGSSSG